MTTKYARQYITISEVVKLYFLISCTFVQILAAECGQRFTSRWEAQRAIGTREINELEFSRLVGADIERALVNLLIEFKLV